MFWSKIECDACFNMSNLQQKDNLHSRSISVKVSEPISQQKISLKKNQPQKYPLMNTSNNTPTQITSPSKSTQNRFSFSNQIKIIPQTFQVHRKTFTDLGNQNQSSPIFQNLSLRNSLAQQISKDYQLNQLKFERQQNKQMNFHKKLPSQTPIIFGQKIRIESNLNIIKGQTINSITNQNKYYQLSTFKQSHQIQQQIIDKKQKQNNQRQLQKGTRILVKRTYSVQTDSHDKNDRGSIVLSSSGQHENILKLL